MGKPLHAATVRRALRRTFRQALRDVERINADEWTPRELRHGFVSPLSDRAVRRRRSPGSSGTPVTALTEEVYRKQTRPVIHTGAAVVDGISGADPRRP
ncbi:hypothetical protein ACH4UM_33255 [Streptomyces sp. NPDC020801]|uniref:hypothetical protein n=1 Tax=unclassified Streptomyces TaxID=2593676 RepID=UPI0037A1D683